MGYTKEVLPPNIIKLSPSDFSFAWNECRRCFWLKYAVGVERPSKPMATIYTKIDSAMRAYYAGRALVLHDVPTVLDTKVRYLRSAPFFVKGHAKGVIISGKNDALAFPRDRAEGDVDWCYIEDFKTSEPKAEHVGRYANAMEGYAYCLEHPADTKTPPLEVRGHHLIIFTPMAYEQIIPTAETARALTGQEKILPIPRESAKFEQFLTDVVVLLNGPIPAPNGVCGFCNMDRETEALRREVEELQAKLAAA